MSTSVKKQQKEHLLSSYILNHENILSVLSFIKAERNDTSKAALPGAAVYNKTVIIVSDATFVGLLFGAFFPSAVAFVY